MPSVKDTLREMNFVKCVVSIFAATTCITHDHEEPRATECNKVQEILAAKFLILLLLTIKETMCHRFLISWLQIFRNRKK